jgi:hypothetical protein
MLNMKVQLVVKARLKGKCPNHPRYNPEQGQGAIRGGCQHCLELYEAVRARDLLLQAAGRFETATQPFVIKRPAKPARSV